ncbi:hypothetical protein GYMLUDRAFT_42285 [Collybiopsis luxurians FD-317 M1]|uniref:6-phosphogluconate dehydrogenase, decarboxylating n=1 Tax=Collybiopsis luxurians FD-317 M1 TaxID=944289 RepID=A0A0D0CGU7_9AGAR|nr:hypothetical protein GYMLUDRAFT_42285 [Collybiopsis luxurians FD-317 M1]
MGSMMSLMFAERGIHIHFFDPSSTNEQELQSRARDANLTNKITQHDDHASLCSALGSPKVFIFSVPHGSVADQSIDDLEPHLDQGDIILDGSNEYWANTERRQARLAPKGVHFIGMGVSGGYQSARRSPSISPGGSKEALDFVFPFLEHFAAKDKLGRSCVAKLGPGGCGHYTKMVHNGIEQGLMSALCEVWGIMNAGLGMSFAEIADVFESWNKDGLLADNFLVGIGVEICRTKDKSGEYVLANIRDKVVQDADDTEGTGIWTVEEGIRLHVPIPTIAAAHQFRVASAYAARREAVQKSLKDGAVQPRAFDGDDKVFDKKSFLRDLHDATIFTFLMSFIQGMHLLARANDKHDWRMDFQSVLQIWRGGCIIQSDKIVDLLEQVYKHNCDSNNLLAHPQIADALGKRFPALKKVVVHALNADCHVPTLAASLEYYKYSGSTDLPTSFQEAELDYFGNHKYDLKTEDPGEPVTGKHHFEWKPARGLVDEKR